MALRKGQNFAIGRPIQGPMIKASGPRVYSVLSTTKSWNHINSNSLVRGAEKSDLAAIR